MNDPPPILDDAAWANYVEKLRSHGVPVDELTVPGLSDAEMDERMASIGLTLPDEARVLWGWHDGVPRELWVNPLGGFGKSFLSLDEAVQLHREFRESVLKLLEQEPDIGFDPDLSFASCWLPLLGPQHPVVIDCSVGRDQPTPLRMVDLEDPEEPRVRVRSLGEAVRLWTDALDRGLWRWDAGTQDWRRDLSSLSGPLRTSPLL